MDSADSDPATFVDYLRRPVNSIRVAAAKPLLLLTPAYLQDLLGFSRRFFRDLFDRLTDSSYWSSTTSRRSQPIQLFRT